MSYEQSNEDEMPICPPHQCYMAQYVRVTEDQYESRTNESLTVLEVKVASLN